MRMRTPLTLIVLAALAMAAWGCGGNQSQATSTTHIPGTTSIPFKIGIMTGTVSQGEEDFRGAQQVIAKYGSDHVKHVTYPDNFSSEMETVISQLTGLAADPDVKVIVVGQAIPGSASAARKIRETRPDILIGFVGPHEDPDVINPVCDIAIQPDQIARGTTIVETAQQMGAKNFVHYSFPRHMAQLLLKKRKDIMEEECKKRGMKFYFVTAPDPTSEAGLPGAQQFILEDVPREIQKLGPATAFYTTNDGMQEPLIRSVLQYGGYFVEQDVPAPTAGYPAALGMAIPPEKAGDMTYINAEIARLVAAKGKSGHFGSWTQPVDMVAIRAFTDLMVEAAQRKADLRDSTAVLAHLEKEAGGSVRIRKYDRVGNQWLVVLPHITY